MSDNKVIQAVYEQVAKRNAGEVEFLQAVKEVLDSLGGVLDKHPEYADKYGVEYLEAKKP